MGITLEQGEGGCSKGEEKEKKDCKQTENRRKKHNGAIKKKRVLVPDALHLCSPLAHCPDE
jgi:hypothetical protein